MCATRADLELQSARTLFGEKVKELSVALAKVEALTKQLEELKSGNTKNSYHIASATAPGSIKYNQELEKLRQELLVSSRELLRRARARLRIANICALNCSLIGAACHQDDRHRRIAV